MNSKIYTARAMHARGWPVRHRFSYPLYVYGIDVDELPQLDRKVRFFGHNRLRLAAIHDKDFLYPGAETIRAKVVRCLDEHDKDTRVDRIMMVTSARFLNYVFNPVTFFYCYGHDGCLQAFIAFVNNTFGESHVYVLSDQLEPKKGFSAHFQASKKFHVSPFFDLHGRYDFHVLDPADRLDVLMTLTKEQGHVFTARLRGEGRELTTRNMIRTIGRYPVTASITMPRILSQAARLYYQRKLPVFHKPNPASPDTIRFIPPTLTQRLAMKGVLALFSRFHDGRIRLTLPDRSTREYGGRDGEPDVTLIVHNHDFFRRIATGDDVGLGESYMAGDWECSDLTGLLTVFLRNWDVIRGRRRTGSLPARYRDYALHLARGNTRLGSRRNIRAHYDLDNRFFQLFLDESMTYSCGMFLTPDDTLAQAQKNKIDSIIRKADIGPDAHVLEVGCGWGGFAIEAARQTGCRVTGITVSDAQHELAVARVREAGLSDRVEIRRCDYRNIEGVFDRIVSIEMLEAVGHRNLGTYFAALARALRPEGRVVVQVITIPDQRYRQYRRRADFIRKHIFPGGHLPSLGALTEAACRRSPLNIEHVENIGAHYAPTLKAWCERLLAARDEAMELGFDDAFIRKWEYYFCYCEAGFAAHVLNDLQLVLRPTGP